MEKYVRIQKAISSNSLDDLKKILEEVPIGGIDLFEQQYRIPILGLAIKSQCSIDIIKELINSRCNLNDGLDPENLQADINPLVLACRNKNYEVMELLIKAGGIVEVRDSIGTPLIHIACRYDVRFVKLLVENGADPHALTTDKNTTLHTAVYQKAPYEVFHFLLKCGVNPSEKNSFNQTPLELMTIDQVYYDAGISTMIKIAIEQRKGGATLSLKRKLEFKNSPSEKAKAELEKDRKKGKNMEQSVVSAYKKLKSAQSKRKEFLKESVAKRKSKMKFIDTDTKVFGTPLECPICFADFMKDSVILQCVNGHVLCHDCHPKFMACPQCKVPLNQKASIRNRVLENIVTSMKSTNRSI